MKKYTWTVLLLSLFIGCKKNDTKPAVDTRNLELIMTCDCTFDIQVVERANATLQSYTVADLVNVSKKYDVKLNGTKDDLLQIKFKNVSPTPIQVTVLYNGTSIFDHNAQTDIAGNYSVYVPY